MQKPPISKYAPFPRIELPDRQWPSKTIDRAPIWCSVDLRDGNQALAIPMSIDEKVEMFETLVRLGFKEIEVGFPAASQIEFDFIRRIIDEDRIPGDVAIQVLTQAREELIRRTFDAVRGAQRAIVHIYNSTSPAQRRVVFDMKKPEIVDIAVGGVTLIRELAPTVPETAVTLQYSPESFSTTEIDFALEICEAVMDVWQPSPEAPIILNLPATVEMCTPNVHADQIEWFCRHLRRRESAIISLHTHNDRGTGIAASELGLMAGADRVEGTLFGNGERTGNVDIVTLALNMYTQGVHPNLDFSDINAVRETYERCTRMEVAPRTPYAGELVFTAFSGSHQDAINKGLAARNEAGEERWEVPYLPIDPQDIGRNYRAIIRINSQSGKGGVAYIMEHEYGLKLPREMRRELGRIVNDLADRTGRELTPEHVYNAFADEFLKADAPLKLENFRVKSDGDSGDDVTCSATLRINGDTRKIGGSGNGPIAAFFHALENEDFERTELVSYSEHSIGEGADSQAISYIQLKRKDGRTFYGAGIDSNIERASLKAVVSALNRCLKY